MRFAACAAVATFASLGATTSSRVAHADDVADEADLQFRLAAEKYQAGDYRGALEHFLASNRLAPNRNVLFNIARCYEALHEYPDAYRYYVRASQGESDPAARTRIDEAMKRMAPNVAILKVVTDPPGATLYLDRKDLGQRGAGPQTLGLASGTYRVIAEAPGYEDAVSEPTTIQAGGTATVDLKLVRILGTVHVAGDEATGATVRVDSEESPPRCIAPCDLQLPPGRHTLYVSREGYKAFVTLVDVIAKQTVTTHPSIEAKTGTVVVSTDEPGAVVEIDGFARGPTPALLTLPVGKHDVRVTMRGFRTIARTINVEANAETRLDNLPLVPLEEVEAASRIAESVEDAPASVSIISQQELRGMAYPTVFQALEGVRGVYLSDDRGYDTAGFRGFGRPGDYGDRTLVLLNGQPMNDNWLWSSYIGYDLRTDLEDVQRIEVVRGPGSVLYGTGAVSGVINIVTRPHDAQTGYEAGASTADGTVGRGRVRAAYDFGGGAGMWTSAQASHSSGSSYYFPQYASDSLTQGTTPASADRFNAGTWTGQIWWKALSLQWSLNSHDKHLPTGQFSTILGDDRTQQTDTRGMVEAKFEPRLTSTLQSVTRAHVNYYQYDGTFAAIPELGGVSHTGYKGSWAGVEERLVFTPVHTVRITAGAELQEHFLADQEGDLEYSTITLDGQPRSVATGTPYQFLHDHHTFQIGAGYAVADFTPTRAVKVSLGGRYDDYSTFGGSFNPRIAVILKPYEAGNIKLMFGKAFLAPSVYQIYYQQPGIEATAPNLHSESMYSAEIEYSHRFTPTVVGLLAAYENVITDLITLEADPTCGGSCVQYQNTTTPVGTVGGEAEIRKEWKDGWMASASYSFAHSVYLRDGSFSSITSLARDPTRREVPNAPENLASLHGGAPILGRALMAMTRLSFASGRYDINDRQSTLGSPQPPQTETNPALVWDLVLSGQEQRYHLRYSLGMYNVFDWKYAVPVSSEFTQPNGAALGTIVQNGRTVMAAAYVNF
jgi:outer membrane receptor protein involved in Fe transport